MHFVKIEINRKMCAQNNESALRMNFGTSFSFWIDYFELCMRLMFCIIISSKIHIYVVPILLEYIKLDPINLPQ